MQKSLSDDQLPPRQQRFVDEYVLSLNATDAMRRAGYSARTANVTSSQLLAKPNISALVAQRLKARAEQRGLDAAWVLDQLRGIVEQAREIGKSRELSAANRALELIGRHLRMWHDDEQRPLAPPVVNVNVQLGIVHGLLSDPTARRSLDALAERVETLALLPPKTDPSTPTKPVALNSSVSGVQEPIPNVALTDT